MPNKLMDTKRYISDFNEFIFVRGRQHFLICWESHILLRIQENLEISEIKNYKNKKQKNIMHWAENMLHKGG